MILAAIAIGGGSLLGGRVSIILGSRRNGLILMTVQGFYQLRATGIIIIVAVQAKRKLQGTPS